VLRKLLKKTNQAAEANAQPLTTLALPPPQMPKQATT
jgi:hypothetical protein